MSLTINGKIKKILDLEQGTSKSGKEWQKQSVVIEQNVDREWNKEVCVSAFGTDKINQLNKFSEGDTIDVLCNVYSREFNGKYYTSLDGYWFANQNAEAHTSSDVESDDLPF
tara:strand:+ start:1847 stop:2182 length:336 start_codon:yes stop_codon:yes gene_type:complete